MAFVIAATAAGLLAAAFFAACRMGTLRFRDRYAAEKADLLRRGRQPTPPPPPLVPDEELPAPVRRYRNIGRAFERPAPRTAVVKQRGALRTAADGAWLPFESEQAYSMEPPGFVWLARARMAPLVFLLARDKFVDGKGHMLVSLLGLLTVADGRGPEMDLGAGLRYWGEIVAFPEAVGSRHLRWEAIDETHARLHVDQGGLRLTAIVEFGNDGLPMGLRAERYRDVKGTPVLTPWSGRFRGWKHFGGRLFPTDWEAIWHLLEGDFHAVRLEVLDLQVE